MKTKDESLFTKGLSSAMGTSGLWKNFRKKFQIRIKIVKNKKKKSRKIKALKNLIIFHNIFMFS